MIYLTFSLLVASQVVENFFTWYLKGAVNDFTHSSQPKSLALSLGMASQTEVPGPCSCFCLMHLEKLSSIPGASLSWDRGCEWPDVSPPSLGLTVFECMFIRVGDTHVSEHYILILLRVPFFLAEILPRSKPLADAESWFCWKCALHLYRWFLQVFNDMLSAAQTC